LDSLAEAYFLWGKLDAAVAKYREVLEINPDFVTSHISMAYVLALKEDYSQAISHLDQWMARVQAPRFRLESHWLKGFYYYSLGALEQALAEFESVGKIGEETNNLMPQITNEFYLGLIHCSRGNLEASQKHLQNFLDAVTKAFPEFRERATATYNFGMGLIQIRKGDVNPAKTRLDEIKSFLSKARDISETLKMEYTDMFNYLAAEIMLKEGLPQKAIELFETVSPPKSFAISGSDIIGNNLLYPKDLLARAYEQAGDLARAIAEHEKIVTFNPNIPDRRLINPLDYYRLGKLYEKKGEKAKATVRYRRFLDLWKDADPGTLELEGAKARLAALEP